MIKKVMCIVLSVLCCFPLTACAQDNDKPNSETLPTEQALFEAVPLTEEEIGILDAMGTDVNTVTDEEYVQMVAEIANHAHSFVGKVYQMEGVISIDGENASVYRMLVNGEETLKHGLPLRYLSKDIADGAWIRVTGVVAEAEINGVTAAVLDIVAVEALAEYGQDQLDWDGSDVHKH